MTPEMWDRLRNMTDEEALAAARSDPDARPLEDAKPGSPPPRRISRAKFVRWQLGLSQDAFAETFCIPIGTLRDWEQHRNVPDHAAAAYLEVILREPDAVRRALKERAKELVKA